jgi:hypothetical protein
VAFTCLDRCADAGARRRSRVAASAARWDMTSACDIRYCDQPTPSSCIQEINIGMTADVGTFPRLCKLIPEGWVRETGLHRPPASGASRPRDRPGERGVSTAHEEVVAHALATAREIASKAPLAVDRLEGDDQLRPRPHPDRRRAGLHRRVADRRCSPVRTWPRRSRPRPGEARRRLPRPAPGAPQDVTSPDRAIAVPSRHARSRRPTLPRRRPRPLQLPCPPEKGRITGTFARMLLKPMSQHPMGEPHPLRALRAYVQPAMFALVAAVALILALAIGAHSEHRTSARPDRCTRTCARSAARDRTGAVPVQGRGSRRTRLCADGREAFLAPYQSAVQTLTPAYERMKRRIQAQGLHPDDWAQIDAQVDRGCRHRGGSSPRERRTTRMPNPFRS